MNNANGLTPGRRRELVLGFDDSDFEVVQGEVALLAGHFEEAKLRLEYAARRGHAEAQYKLGTLCYEQESHRAAEKWFRLAAWQGHHPAAQRRLAGLYYERAEFMAAKKHMRDSAEGGDAGGQQALALWLLEDDEGTADVEACAWLALAGEQGPLDADVEQLFAGLKAKLTPAEVAEAGRLVMQAKARISKRSRRFSKMLKRRQNRRRGPCHLVGRQEMMGSFETWDVSYAVQRCGDHDWILHIDWAGKKTKDGPMSPGGLIETLEELELDIDAFVADLRSCGQPSLNVLAREMKHILRLTNERGAAVAAPAAPEPAGRSGPF